MEDIRKALEEKYADVCNDLLAKYGGTADAGFEYFIAMARAWFFGEETLYTTDLAVNKDEIHNDYKEYLHLSLLNAKDKNLL